MEIAKALRIDVDDQLNDSEDEEEYCFKEDCGEIVPTSSQNRRVSGNVADIGKVQVDGSPYFYAFYKSHPVHLVVDTGATSSVVSATFLKRAGITIKPTNHSARAVDKAPLSISGEIRITLQFSDLDLPITALVVDSLDCDILAGMPFCVENDVTVHCLLRQISIKSITFNYGEKLESAAKGSKLYKVDSFIVRNNKKTVLLPGEYLEFSSEELEGYEGDVAIEPFQQEEKNPWPSHAMSRVIQGKIRIHNDTEEPIEIGKSAHIAKIRRVSQPSLITPKNEITPHTTKAHQKGSELDNTHLISVDPDNLLNPAEKAAFLKINSAYAQVFTSNFGAYNDASGKIRSHIDIGPVMHAPKKTKLPFYGSSDLQLLQDEADKLEALGVLAKPEDVEVEVKHASPSFLRGKPSGGHRFVTAFNELADYVRIPPSVAVSCNDIVRKIGAWKYLIKCDLTKSFYQIRVTKASMPFLGIVTPYKGVRVYTRCAMGMPGSSEILQELTSRVLGDLVQDGNVAVIYDDIFSGANTIEEVIRIWEIVLERLRNNNLSLSAPKTVICPKKTSVLGWIWKLGTLTASPHKTAPLDSVNPPKTCTNMRSFIGAFKALARCFRGYSSLVSPLEEAIKGLQGCQRIEWSEELLASFKQVQVTLKDPAILTIPRPTDILQLEPDGAVVNKGIGATLFVIRDDKRLLAEFFSKKLKLYQVNWQPCEIEALAIASATNSVSPYVRESLNPLHINTDSKPCVDAHALLRKGHFSTSARVSSFLSTLSSYRVIMTHIKGSSNSGDFASRNPIECNEDHCQVCKFVEEACNSVVRSVEVADILSGATKMPFQNHTAWLSVQRECDTLRRVYAHLTQGTRPARKSRNLKDLRKYLQISSINDQGLLVVKKSDTFGVERKLIIVPTQILPGTITALHLQLSHPTKTQFEKVFSRYFYGLNSVSVIANVTMACGLCNSVKKIPTELFQQNSTPSPDHPGGLFTADVMRRAKQKILLTRDIFSSFTTGEILENESHTQLRNGLLSTSALIRGDRCSVHVDNAPGFKALQYDQQLKDAQITLDYGRVKNKNKNAVADKCVQELEEILRKSCASYRPITKKELDNALLIINKQIRNRDYSAKELLFQWDQHSGMQLSFNDKKLAQRQKSLRSGNHFSSERSKAKGGIPAQPADVTIGDLVHIKSEGDKFHPRERYIIVSMQDKFTTLQKLEDKKKASKK